jgi:hypothetical protein
VLPLTVKASFFVCSAEMCVPEDLTLRLDLPVREGAAPLDRRHGAAITTVLEQAPRPAGIEARIALENGVLTLSAAGGALAGRDPGPSYFFPFSGGVIDHPAAQTGAWGPQGLTLRLSPGGETRAAGLTGPVEGVLVTAHGAWDIRAEAGAPLAGTSGSGTLGAADLSDAHCGSASGTSPAVFGPGASVRRPRRPDPEPDALRLSDAGDEGGVAGEASAHAVQRPGATAWPSLAGVLITFLFWPAACWVYARRVRPSAGASSCSRRWSQRGLALLILAVALNLSGVFHVGAGCRRRPAPGPLSRLPGGLGAFFTGALAVIVAAPCTAPFMAFALGAALVMPGPLALLVFLDAGARARPALRRGQPVARPARETAPSRTLDGAAQERAGLPHVRRGPLARLGVPARPGPMRSACCSPRDCCWRWGPG